MKYYIILEKIDKYPSEVMLKFSINYNRGINFGHFKEKIIEKYSLLDYINEYGDEIHPWIFHNRPVDIKLKYILAEMYSEVRLYLYSLNN